MFNAYLCNSFLAMLFFLKNCHWWCTPAPPLERLSEAFASLAWIERSRMLVPKPYNEQTRLLQDVLTSQYWKSGLFAQEQGQLHAGIMNILMKKLLFLLWEPGSFLKFFTILTKHLLKSFLLYSCGKEKNNHQQCLCPSTWMCENVMLHNKLWK